MKKNKLFCIIFGIVIIAGLLIIIFINFFKPTYYAFGDYDYKKGLEFPTDIKDYKKIVNNNKTNVLLRKKGNKKSVCFVSNDELICFDSNNYKYELNHLIKVFGKDNCESGLITICHKDKIYCSVEKDGSIECEDDETIKYCSILFDGSTSCGNYE